MFRTRPQKRAANDLDLTPMVDVTFLLLIFFMVTASFTLQKTMASPPTHQAGETAAAQSIHNDLSIEVRIDHRNRIYVEGKVAETTEEITRAITDEMARQASTSLLVIAHRDSLHEYAIRVYDAAQEAKIQTIRQQLAESI